MISDNEMNYQQTQDEKQLEQNPDCLYINEVKKSYGIKQRLLKLFKNLTMQNKTTTEKLIIRKKIKSIFKKCILGIVTLIGICLMYLCFSNVYQQLFNSYNRTGFFNIGNAVVASSSMEPDIYPNDLVFYKKTDINDIAVGDTIVYVTNDKNDEDVLIIHNVISIDEEKNIITQGINNTTHDKPIQPSSVVGKYIFRIPSVGVLINMLSSVWMTVLFIFILLLVTVFKIWQFNRKKKKTINSISLNEDTRSALSHFFDV